MRNICKLKRRKAFTSSSSSNDSKLKRPLYRKAPASMSSSSDDSSSSSSDSSSSSSSDSSSSSSSNDSSSSSSSSDDSSSSSSSSDDSSSSSSSSDDSSSSSQSDSSSSSSDTDSSSSSDTDSSSSLSSIPATSTPSCSLKRKRSMVTSKGAQSSKSFCDICMDKKARSEMFSNAGACHHQYCSDCIRQHVSMKIRENTIKVKCPDPNCKGVIGPELCRSIVPKEVLDRWENALCESMISGTQKFYCPFKDCSLMLVDDGEEVVTSSECPNCHRLFCAQCKVAWHSGMDCSAFKCLKKGDRNLEDKMLKKLAKIKEWRRCPKCKFFVEKSSGCNHIICRCGYQFCYRCGKKYHISHACN